MKIIPPVRATHHYRQAIEGAPERVFPLMCPVREVDWVAGWEPRLVISASGLVERDCVFTTPDGGHEATWYVTRHEPDDWFVEMLKLTPGVTAVRLQIRLTPRDGGCHADVSYSYTSLGPEGDAAVAGFTAERYREFMQLWERELNHYLATGELLQPQR